MASRRMLTLVAGGAAVLVLLAGSLTWKNGLASERTVYTQLSVLTEVLRLVSDNYVEPIVSEDLVDEAIRGMLADLDPHSNYLDPERYARTQERNRGSYHGIGISFEIVDGDLTVVSVIEGGPSEKLGLRPGDVIIRINGASAKGIKQEEVQEKLRGERGTMVHVTIRRPGDSELHEFDIVRDQIPIYSVPYSFILSPGIGYVRMTRFSSTTSEELEEALRKLAAEGMEKLILDLRGNPGGYLNAAVDVADKFLPKGRKLVYTLGRLADSNEEYYSTGRGTHTKYPLIILVDHYSASASEIVSGAVQDWDHGLVIGETTFGKGLVQRQYQLKNGGALLLTVARYYTPSGRLIQRDYSDKEKYYTEEVEEIDASATVDSAGKPAPEYHTASGRIVYGGGGITPDVRLEQKWLFSRLQRTLERQYFDFANEYISKNRLQPPSFEEFRKGFPIEGGVLAEFQTFLKERSVEFSPDSLRAEADQVANGIRRELARNLWGENARWQVLIESDPQVAEAVALFPRAELMARNEPTGDWQSRAR